MLGNQTVGVVIPAYRVVGQILEVLTEIPDFVDAIVVVDDNCPDGSGHVVEANIDDERVQVVYHVDNLGVGGASISGIQAMVRNGTQLIVKVDGDGQMDQNKMQELLRPLLNGSADFAKGNRFFSLDHLQEMPKIRIFGNAMLSLMSKFSTGYWRINDPTNGYFAIRRGLAEQIDFRKVRKDYFFESDLLFRSSIVRGVVVDVPMSARYRDETSNLNIPKVAAMFPFFHLRNFAKRIFYTYFLREWSLASFQLPIGLISLFSSLALAVSALVSSAQTATAVTAGQAVGIAFSGLFSVQMLLAFLSFDIDSEPSRPISYGEDQ